MHCMLKLKSVWLKIKTLSNEEMMKELGLTDADLADVEVDIE